MANYDLYDYGISQEQIELYFCIDQWLKKWKWGATIFLLVAIPWYWLEIHVGYLFFRDTFFFGIPYFWVPTILGVLCIVRIVKMIKNCPNDSDIDSAWILAAESRIDEAMLKSHLEEEDLALPEGESLDYFFGQPQGFQEKLPYRYKIGEDGMLRWNYLQLVFIIYGKKTLSQFDEPFCLENQWDGLDRTEEYYWKDISGVKFDQREQIFEINTSGGKEAFPLSSDGYAYKAERAEKIAKTCRTILRQKKD